MCFRVCACIHQSGLVRTVTSLLMDGFQNNLAHLFYIMSRSAILKLSFRKVKVKVMRARQAVPGQPSSSTTFSIISKTEIIISVEFN